MELNSDFTEGNMGIHIIWKLNIRLLKTHGSKKKSWEILKCFELNEKENIIYQNLWDAVKAALSGNFKHSILILEKKDLKSNI